MPRLLMLAAAVVTLVACLRQPWLVVEGAPLGFAELRTSSVWHEATVAWAMTAGAAALALGIAAPALRPQRVGGDRVDSSPGRAALAPVAPAAVGPPLPGHSHTPAGIASDTAATMCMGDGACRGDPVRSVPIHCAMWLACVAWLAVALGALSVAGHVLARALDPGATPVHIGVAPVAALLLVAGSIAWLPLRRCGAPAAWAAAGLGLHALLPVGRTAAAPAFHFDAMILGAFAQESGPLRAAAAWTEAAFVAGIAACLAAAALAFPAACSPSPRAARRASVALAIAVAASLAVAAAVAGGALVAWLRSPVAGFAWNPWLAAGLGGAAWTAARDAGRVARGAR